MMKDGATKGQSKVGGGTRSSDIASDRPKYQSKGAARQLGGDVQDAIGAVEDALFGAAESVSETASAIGDQAREVYEKVSQGAQDIAAYVDPFVQDRTYLALGGAALTGLIVGLLIGGRGSTTIYLKSHR